jgi:hypothetical protein
MCLQIAEERLWYIASPKWAPSALLLLTSCLLDGGGAHGVVISVVEGRVLNSNLFVDLLATNVHLTSELELGFGVGLAAGQE